MIQPKKVFNILLTITSLCLEKSEGAQFLKKKLLLFQNGSFLPQLGPKNLIALFLGVNLRIFFMMMRHYSYIKNIE